MGEVEIVVKVRVPEGVDAEMERVIRKRIAVDAVKEIEEKIRKAKRFEDILLASKPDKEELQKLANEIGESVAKHYGVL